MKRDIAQLAGRAIQPRESWLGAFRRAPQARITLFCFPYAGGTNLIYKNWAAHLPPSIALCPLLLPGRASRLHEPAFTDVFSMVEAIAEAIRPDLGMPFAFFGHSMGGLIGLELARLLRRQDGAQPEHLFVSGCRAPQIPDPDPPTYNLPDAEFLAEVDRLNGTPKDVLEHPELMKLLVPLLRADFQVCQGYVSPPEPPLSCPITAFGGLQDSDIPRAHITAWSEATTGRFTHRMLPGDHFFLHAHEPLIVHAVASELLAAGV